jgi:protein phosphatase
MKLVVGVKTDVGRVREGNQDSYLVEAPLFAVADGMGGHLAGDVASATAIEALHNRLSRSEVSPEDLEEAIKIANEEIRSKAGSDPSLSGMGTTCTVLAVDGSTGYVAHVGDSRAYLYRSGELTQLTEDHTLVQRLVQEGRLSEEEAEHHPQRSIITRALGIEDTLEVDSMILELNDGDRVLMCSDGLTSMLNHQAIEQVLREEGEPQAAADRLVDLANDRGGEDNITVLLVDIREDGGAPPPPPASRSDVTEGDQPPGARTEARPDIRDEDLTEGNRKGILRRIAALIAIVGLVVLGGYLAVHYYLTHTYYVGADSSGSVAIFQGVPGEIAGVSLSTPLEIGTIRLSDLPAYLRDDVRSGIKADSLKDARAKVNNLERRARSLKQTRQQKKNGGGQTGKG